MGRNYDRLLFEYKKLWNNRALVGNDSQAILFLTIERDLRDELTHPRVRKQPLEKFYLAIKRINESIIEDKDKSALIQIYINLLEKTQNG
ncbi:hypothetical protein [Litchfieldia salsa]|uniref:Uncharacterized protein n=1 Tax=Litchfieldia salsa TaxID=930152 RepID=A0A1H0TDF8_9BACI|nr:hypothetical protein [Litchfieldia salsa]SDP52057.1 hypothetical protein SAMN05216565_103441 [Litchfieldia salsa]